MSENYLFTQTAAIATQWEKQHTDEKLIRMGIGDFVHPIAPAIICEMQLAAAELGDMAGFRGYGPEQGYLFLRELIAEHEYRQRGIGILPDEIFVSDGAKSDCGGILDLFDKENRIGVCDPVYPAYADAAAIGGFAGEYDADTDRWSRLLYLPCTESNSFIPGIPDDELDIVYLCSPNNPTGAAMNRQQLECWVTWANSNKAVIIYDGAYEAYITDPLVPRSIYEVDGAKTCAIELRSFSKTAGFTGVRCSYTVIPEELIMGNSGLKSMWKRRQAARFNGVSYITQKAAAAVYSEEGHKQMRAQVEYYLDNARMIRNKMQQLGFGVYGGENAPYIWVKAPGGLTGWDFFHRLLEKCAVLSTPGEGFGPHGNEYVRLSAFCQRRFVEKALDRIEQEFS